MRRGTDFDMTGRIHSIDAVRGLCLVNIFVNHITLGTLLELSPSKIAFCDSADLFVLLAGISSFLAYGPRKEAWAWKEARGRMWRRALTLYGANLIVIAASFLILQIGSAGAPPPAPSQMPGALIESAGLINYWWQALSMQQSVGYSMVLRLYVALMLVAPFYVWLAGKRFWYPLVPAGLIWLVGGHFLLAERDSLTGTLLSMTILPWQLVFAAGVAIGAAIVQRVALPSAPWLTRTACVVVVGGTAFLLLAPYLSADARLWLEARNDAFWTGISKSYQSPLRLLYTFALAYSFVALREAPFIRLLHRANPEGFLCRLGRNSLRVFALGAILALAIDQLLWNLMAAGLIGQRSGAAILVELGLVGLGLYAMARIAAPRPKRLVTPTGFEPVTY
jgi:hypothetical protein